MGTFLYPDTNIMLHYKQFDQIDWLKLTGEASVSLLLTPQFIREADKAKRTAETSRARDRARDFSTWLRKWEDGGEKEISANVTMQILSLIVPQQFYADHELDSSEGDDKHLAAIVLNMKNHTGDKHILVTRDYGIGRKARILGVRDIEPVQTDAVKDEPDKEQKEIARLTRELAKAVDTKSLLSVSFPDGNAHHHIVREIYEDNTEGLNRTIRRLQLGWANRLPVANWAPKPFAMYRADLTEWYSDSIRVAKMNARLVPLPLLLGNDGGGPATKIEIILEAPEMLTITNVGPSPANQIPRQKLGSSTIRIHRESDLPTPGCTWLESFADTRHKVRIVNIPDLNHKRTAPLPTLYVAFPEGVTPYNFSLKYETFSATQIEPRSGPLQLQIQTIAKPFQFPSIEIDID